MKQIYKQLYEDEEGRYYFATDTDTKPVVDQVGYLLIYLIELMMNKEEEREIFLSNENMEEKK